MSDIKDGIRVKGRIFKPEVQVSYSPGENNTDDIDSRSVTIRIDDAKNPEFWTEVTLPFWVVYKMYSTLEYGVLPND